MKTAVVLKDISLISVLEIDKHFRPDKILKIYDEKGTIHNVSKEVFSELLKLTDLIDTDFDSVFKRVRLWNTIRLNPKYRWSMIRYKEYMDSKEDKDGYISYFSPEDERYLDFLNKIQNNINKIMGV